MTDDDLERLAADVLDRKPIDWTALEAAASPPTRRRLASLRALERIQAASCTHLGGAADGQRRERWDEFELIEPIGHGVFGEVWRAYDPQLDRDIALKLIAADDDGDAHDVVQEGRLLARIHHPNVAAVFGASRWGREIGIAMQYVAGDDLAAHVREHGAMPPGAVLDIGLQLARALEAVHRAGVLHRDVKASNVKRTSDGRVMLLDFGSGRELRARATEVEAVQECGTPRYVAPEVLTGGSATVLSDLYSLGVLLFHLLTARYPVEAHSFDELRRAHDRQPRHLLLPAGVPRRLNRFLRATLSIDPRGRPQSAAQAAAMLESHRVRTGSVIAVGGAALVLAAAFLITGRSRQATPGEGAEVIRRIEWPVAPHTMGIPSRDGRVLPFVERRNGGLSLLDVTTGAVQRITADTELAGGYATTAAASPDGSTVAFGWHESSGDCDELRAMRVSTRHQSVISPCQRAVALRPTGWSPDGRSIAFLVGHTDGTATLWTVTTPQPPRELAHGYIGHGAFDDDGRYVAFERSETLNAAARLWIADLRTGRVAPALEGTFDDRAPVWIGDTLVFASDRSGGQALWAGAFDRRVGRITGEPHLIRAHAMGIEPVSATENGTLFYKGGVSNSGVFVGRTDGAPPQERVSSVDVGGFSPDWAPNGTTLAWIEEHGESYPVRHILRLYDLRTKATRAFAGLGRGFPTNTIGLNPRFTRGGRSVLVRAAGGGGVRVVDVDTGRESPTMLADRNFGDIEWDAQTGHAFFVDFDRGVVRVDMRNGAEEWLYRPPADSQMSRGIALSPDWQSVAFTIVSRGPDRTVTIMMMDRNGRGARARWSERPTHPQFQAPLLSAVPLLLGEWTPDGRMLLFAKAVVLSSGFLRADTELWGLPTDGGPPKRLGLTAVGLRDMRPHPDGSRIAYTYFDEHQELWVLRGALGAGAVR